MERKKLRDRFIDQYLRTFLGYSELKDGYTILDIARAFRKTYSWTQNMIHVLADLGFVILKREGRTIRIYMTDKGKRLRSLAIELHKLIFETHTPNFLTLECAVCGSKVRVSANPNGTLKPNQKCSVCGSREFV